MSAFYTTKALGREWLPSPVRGGQKGRYGSWPPLNPPKLRQPQEPASRRCYLRWSRAHERFALAVVLLITLWTFGGSLRQQIGQKFHVPEYHPSFHLPWLSPSTSVDALNLVFPNETWSSFAYITYATDLPNLCSSLQLLSTLQTLNTKPDRLLLYPGDRWNISDMSSQNTEARLLRLARDTYGAKLQPISLYNTIISPTADGSAWANSFTKLLAFNQTQYRRVLALDSDSTILKSLDHLFLLPPEINIAMPGAYWEEPNKFVMPKTKKLCSSMILLTPSEVTFQIIEWLTTHRGVNDYDMEIVNKLFYSSSPASSALILPHRGYMLLTGEFRSSNHTAYLGPDSETWNAKKEIEEAYYVHFSDFPLPKPWGIQTLELLKGARPNGTDEREIWDWLYRDFRLRRSEVCGSEFESWLEVDQEELIKAEETKGRDENGIDATKVTGNVVVETIVVEV